MKKGCLILLGAALFALVVAAIFIGIAEQRYGVLISAPEVSHESVLAARPGSAVRPGVWFRLEPERARQIVESVIEDMDVPGLSGGMLDRFMPHAASCMLAADYDEGEIYIHLMINEKRLGPVIAEQFNEADIIAKAPEINWSSEGLVAQYRGVLTLEGTVPMPDAQNAAYLSWDHPVQATPLGVEGGHLVEAVLDNRDGGAYVCVASLVAAYDLEMGEDEEDLLMTTIENAMSVRVYGDLVADGALLLHLAIEVLPEVRHRLSVANMKGALSSSFSNAIGRLEEEHGLAITGTVEWNENVLEYDYRFEEGTKVLMLAVSGDLF